MFYSPLSHLIHLVSRAEGEVLVCRIVGRRSHVYSLHKEKCSFVKWSDEAASTVALLPSVGPCGLPIPPIDAILPSAGLPLHLTAPIIQSHAELLTFTPFVSPAEGEVLACKMVRQLSYVSNLHCLVFSLSSRLQKGKCSFVK